MTITELIETYIRPSLGERALDFDLSAIARDVAEPDGRGGWRLRPAFDVQDLDLFDPDAWVETLYAHELRRADA